MVREDLMFFIESIFKGLSDRIWYRLSWGDDRSSSLFVYGGAKEGEGTFEVRDCGTSYLLTTWDDGIVVEVEVGSLKEAVTFLREYFK